MKSHSAGTIHCLRSGVVIGVLALAAAWLLPLHGDEPAGSLHHTRPANGQVTEIRGLNARLRAQRLVARKAEAEYYMARLACQIAEIEFQRYIEHIFPEELASANADIRRAQLDLKRAEERLDWIRNKSYKGFPPLTTTSDELGVKKARFALEQALSKKKVLADFTKGKKTRELKAEAEKARAVELVKKRAWELEKSKGSAIEHQIAQWQAMFAKRGDAKRSRSRSVGGAFRDEA